MKIELKDNTIYTILDISTTNIIKMEIDLSNLETIKNSLTDDNLSSYKLTTDTGELVSEWQNKKLDHLVYSDGIASFVLQDIDVTEKKANEALQTALNNKESIMALSDMLIMSTMPSI